jgi:hypothetical protein
MQILSVAVMVLTAVIDRPIGPVSALLGGRVRRRAAHLDISTVSRHRPIKWVTAPLQRHACVERGFRGPTARGSSSAGWSGVPGAAGWIARDRRRRLESCCLRPTAFGPPITTRQDSHFSWRLQFSVSPGPDLFLPNLHAPAAHSVPTLHAFLVTMIHSRE